MPVGRSSGDTTSAAGPAVTGSGVDVCRSLGGLTVTPGLLAWPAMGDPNGFKIVVIDAATAIALSQILPLLLLTLLVELRRTALHRSFSFALVGAFFFIFGVIETVLVLSIDGILYPFQWADLLSALVIFTLLTMIFFISFVEPRNRQGDVPEHENDDL